MNLVTETFSILSANSYFTLEMVRNRRVKH